MNSALRKHLIWGSIFIMIAVFISVSAPTIENAWVVAILLMTIYLFAFEVVSVDVAAICILVLLGLSTLFAPWMGLEKGLVDPDILFNGFASNAVISIIAIMIIGAGLDKTGTMGHVANWILRVGGTSEKRVIPLISTTVGIISSFMQNVGAAALFLPVVSRISARTHIPMSRLLMPMGFCAIIGGTITMVGSSPLILLNELIGNSNNALEAAAAANNTTFEPIKTFGMFDVAPIGIALLIVGIAYFVIAGKFVLPVRDGKGAKAGNTMDYFADTYGLKQFKLFELSLPENSPIIGKNVDEVEQAYGFRILAIEQQDGIRVGSEGIDREIAVNGGITLCVVSGDERIQPLVEQNIISTKPALSTFNNAMSSQKAGIAELVIPPGSSLIGKSARDVWMRKTYGISLLAIHRGDEVINCDHEKSIRNEPLQIGDALVIHTMWTDLVRLETDTDFVVVTTEYPHEELRPTKVVHALIFFTIALGLVLFSNLKLSVSLLTGAVGMILAGVITIEEAYKAVSWKTVFLLASLIPLGSAVESTETAKWIAEQTLLVVGDLPIWGIQLTIATLATFFTLVMSNIGATILLVPLAVNIAFSIGADPAVFALTVAIATSNSFILPTHQVNALIMGPAGYKVKDFMKAGSIMTILFLLVSVGMLNLVF